MRTTILSVTAILAAILTIAVDGAPVDNDDKQSSLCDPGQCFCDDAKPFLIDCKETKLIEVYDPVEWELTVTSKKLTDLDLDVRFNDNKITAIPAFPPGLRIVNLSFRNNTINKIEECAFSELTFLISLDLSYNSFTGQDFPEYVFVGKLNTSYYKPIPLQRLNLSHNNIHSIEKDLFDHLPELTSLDLSYNPIRVLTMGTSMAIGSLRKLQYLSLAHAQLEAITAGLLHELMYLESIDLSGNELTEVPPEIRNCPSLSVLILDGNNIKSLNFESFIGLTNLRTLSISYMNTLKIIEENTFTPLKNLLTLNCQHNKNLDRISNAAFFEIFKKSDTDGVEEWQVKEIALNDNALTHIDWKLAEWENVHYVDIQNNPFRCDCEAKWLIKTLVHQIAQRHPQNAKDLVCSSPAPLKGDNLLDLSELPQIFSRCGTRSADLFRDDFVSDDGYKAVIGDPHSTC